MKNFCRALESWFEDLSVCVKFTGFFMWFHWFSFIKTLFKYWSLLAREQGRLTVIAAVSPNSEEDLWTQHYINASLSFLPAGFQAVSRSLHNDHLESGASLLGKPEHWTKQRPSWLNSSQINETLRPPTCSPLVHICSQALIRSGRGHSLVSVGWLLAIDMSPLCRCDASVASTWPAESDTTTPIVNHNGKISAAINVFDLL